MSRVLELTQQLIRCPSVTPEDAGCQQLLIARLQKLGFDIKEIILGDTHNFFARFGDAEPCLLFVGHTDVVPTGDIDLWKYPPFTPTLEKVLLYGRGAADMKSGLAAMVCACEEFIAKQQRITGSIAFLITSDEEGNGSNGIRKAIDYLTEELSTIKCCIVGEPSSEKKTGDTIKIGRRGSLNGHLTIYGKQGHIAYPHLAENPIQHCLAALQALIDKEWQATAHFPATALQISNIHAGIGVTNVIPGHIEIDFNIRYAANLTMEQLQADIKDILNTYHLTYELKWHHSGFPFLTGPCSLLAAVESSIKEVTGISPTLSTAGGTSDGRYIAPLGIDVIELGVCNATIHQINEHVAVADIETLQEIYIKILEKLLI